MSLTKNFLINYILYHRQGKELGQFIASLTRTFKYLCTNCSISTKFLLPSTEVESFVWKVIDWLDTEMPGNGQLQVTAIFYSLPFLTSNSRTFCLMVIDTNCLGYFCLSRLF